MIERVDTFRRWFRLVVDGVPLAEVGGGELERSGTVLYRERILGSVACGLARCGQPGVLPEGVRAMASRMEHVQRELDEQLRRLVALEPRLAEDAVVLKGVAVQRWWPQGLRRNFGDIDLAVLSEAAFWRVCRCLVHGAGFEIGSLGGAYRRRPEDDWAFSGGFVWRAGSDVPVWIEMHHGFFLPTGSYALDLAPVILDASVQARRAHSAPAPMPVPSRSACLRLLLAEVSSRPLILRDAIDFHFLVLGDGKTRALSGSDVDRACADDLLRGQFHRLAALHLRMSQRDLAGEIGEALRERSGRLRMAAWRRAADWHRLRERVDELSLWQRAGMSRTVSAVKAQRMTGVLRLLHLGPEPRGAARWMADRHGALFLLTPLGPYVATPSQMFSEQFVERMTGGLRELGELPPRA
ncbi:MAG TPA: nucleotidyltransferase family protein [Candidatus Eisenbacteria bacterium]|nr:nucleotidyltransferase family protein [Candidatus Eisenbacteria bacterium]